MILTLSNLEYQFLVSSEFLDDQQKNILLNAIDKNQNKIKISFKEEQLVNLYEILTDELIRSGFDENYEVTKEGLIIEGLIDKLVEM